MQLHRKLLAVLGSLVLATGAQAGLIVWSIDLEMVESDYDPGLIPGWGSSAPAGEDVDAAMARAMAEGFQTPWGDPANRICELSLDVFDGISSRGTCGGPGGDIATAFSFSGSSNGSTLIQFGLDWGLGGYIALTLPGGSSNVSWHSGDIWWQNDWNHEDVFELVIPATPQFEVTGLGFEKCCDGNNSIRWRPQGDEPDSGTPPAGGSVPQDSGQPGQGDPFAAEPGGPPGSWQPLAVNGQPPQPPLVGLLVPQQLAGLVPPVSPLAAANVPAPGAAYLLGLGLLALAWNVSGGAHAGSRRRG